MSTGGGTLDARSDRSPNWSLTTLWPFAQALDACFKGCGRAFHEMMAAKDVLDAVVRLAVSETLEVCAQGGGTLCWGFPHACAGVTQHNTHSQLTHSHLVLATQD